MKMQKIFAILMISTGVTISVINALSVTNRYDSINVNSSINKSNNDISIETLNEAINSLKIDNNGILKAFITSDDRVRNVILRKTIKPERRNFFGLIIIPYIICFFASKGFWPFFPSILQYQVDEMGKKIFSLSDDKIRQFCRGKFNFPDACYRPDISPPAPAPSTTICPPAASSAPPTTGGWDAPARIAAKSPKPSKQSAQNNPDVEVFGSTTKSPSATKAPAKNLDDKQSNINIEIHNVFSFSGESNKPNPEKSEGIQNKIKIFNGTNRTIDDDKK